MLFKRASFGTGRHSVELTITPEGMARLEIEGSNEQDVAVTDEMPLEDMEEALRGLVQFIEAAKQTPK